MSPLTNSDDIVCVINCSGRYVYTLEPLLGQTIEALLYYALSDIIYHRCS